jgi:uncharacterized FAD-dependent dehydrogenase
LEKKRLEFSSTAIPNVFASGDATGLALTTAAITIAKRGVKTLETIFNQRR